MRVCIHSRMKSAVAVSLLVVACGGDKPQSKPSTKSPPDDVGKMDDVGKTTMADGCDGLDLAPPDDGKGVQPAFRCAGYSDAGTC